MGIRSIFSRENNKHIPLQEKLDMHLIYSPKPNISWWELPLLMVGLHVSEDYNFGDKA